MDRQCLECGHRYRTATSGPWLDPSVCPACSSDDTVGVVVRLEDELAALLGETR